MILALDTSGAHTDVSVMRAGEVLSHCTEHHHYVVESALGLVDRALREAGTDMRSLEAVAVCLGPGSFTGLRTGVATAVALELGLTVPLWGVSTFVATVANLLARESAAPEGARHLSVFQEANREELFYAALAYTEGSLSAVTPPCIVPRTAVPGTIGEEVWVSTDGTLSQGVARTVSLCLAAPAQPLMRGGFRWVASVGGESEQLQRGILKPLYLKSVNALTLAERGKQ